jgi:hypothetical protein
MGRGFALGCFFEQGKNRGGELQVQGRGDLDVKRRTVDDGSGMSDGFDELTIVRRPGAKAESLGVGSDEKALVKRLRGLGTIKAFASQCLGREPIRADPFQGIRDRNRQEGGPMRAGCGKNRVDQLAAQTGSSRIVNGDILATRVDVLESARDTFVPLGAAVDDVNIHEGNAGPISTLEEVAVFGGDGHDDLGNVVAVDERLNGVQPDSTARQFTVDLLLLGIAKPR